MKTQILYSKEFDKHDNPTHPENAKRLTAIMNELRNSQFYKKIELIKPTLLSEEILHDVHSSEMIEQIKEISSVGDLWIDPDTYVCKSDFETARLAAGGLLSLCEKVVEDKANNGFALVRPPGHHATQDRPMGFCLINNIAIAANEISKKGKKILIFDHDVHHGNGTQNIFYDRKNVMYQSFHLSPHYPGTGAIKEIGIGEGQGYTINAPLGYGDGDEIVKELLDEIFLPISSQFKPDIILMSSGYDSHHLDNLGGLKLTSNFFGKIISKFQKIQPKIVCTLEGGYNLDWIGKCFLSQIGAMLFDPIEINDTTDDNSHDDRLISQIKNEIGSYWKI